MRSGALRDENRTPRPHQGRRVSPNPHSLPRRVCGTAGGWALGHRPAGRGTLRRVWTGESAVRTPSPVLVSGRATTPHVRAGAGNPHAGPLTA